MASTGEPASGKSASKSPKGKSASKSPKGKSPSSSPPANPASSPGIEANLEPDEYTTDGDSLDEESELGSTKSITDSILEYRKLHGRTFHNFNTGTEYWTPNDPKQNEQLNINHEMLLVAMDNELFFAPIGDSPQRVIDIGTGTGIWAIDFADQFPSAEVIGTDLSPIQPMWVPPNCKFELDDAQLSWTYPDNYFDYVHIRLLIGAIKDWPALYKEVYRCLKPGGWFEHHECDVRVVSDDDTVGPDSPWSKWGDLFLDGGKKLDREFGLIIDGKTRNMMEDGGFEDVSEKRFKVPVGSWAADPKWKTVGEYSRVGTEQGLEGFVLYLATETLGWSVTETQVYLASVRRELKDRTKHPYYESASVFGRKPKHSSDSSSS